VLLSVENLIVEYTTPRGPVRAVDDASFVVPKGAIVGLVGESGCGKTTLARAITGVMSGNAEITGGKLVFLGEDLVKATPNERRARRWRDISFVPQSAMNSLDPVYRVGSQLEEVLVHRGGRTRKHARARSADRGTPPAAPGAHAPGGGATPSSSIAADRRASPRPPAP
jgi:peptide/nickel transport system ATP-binding protein